MNKHFALKHSGGPALSRLASAIAHIAQVDGDHATAIPALTLHRRSAATEPLHCIYTLGLGVIAQGAKQVLLADEVIAYTPGQSMLTTIDLPVVSHVTLASLREPFLGLMLTLDTRLIAQLASELEPAQRLRASTYQSISVEPLDAGLVDGLVRLVEMLNDPALVPSLAPLTQQEIIVRLLSGPHGERLRHLVVAGSPSQQIAKAVAWLKRNFAQSLQVDELAARALT